MQKRLISWCKYCGKVIPTSRDYCRTCVTEGFNNVHAMFGITNEWDKRDRKKVAIEPGWRGQKVIGCTKPKKSIEDMVVSDAIGL